ESGAVDLLLGRMVDGIITVPPPHDVAALARAAGTVPVVQVDWQAEGLVSDGVFLDNRGAGATAARLLLDHGPRRAGVLAGDPSVSTLRDRAAGFHAELLTSGIAPDDALAPKGGYSVADGHAAMRSVLAARPRPTAMFCATYELTLGALIALNE